MFYTIYKITNTVNGKTYIGKHQTSNLQDGYMGSGKLLKRAIRKYGLDKFTKEILHVFQTEEEMNAKEKELVVVSEETYNLCEGGQGGFGHINKSEKKRIEKNKKARAITNDRHGHLLSEWGGKGGRTTYIKHGINKKWFDSGRKSFLGKTHTVETREKMSHAQSKINRKGENNPVYGCMYINNGIKNTVIKKTLPIPDGWKKGKIRLS